MTIANPDVNDSSLDAVEDLRQKIVGVALIGQVCHCCRIDPVPGQKGEGAAFLRYTDGAGRTTPLGYWAFRIDPPQAKVYMIRRAQNIPLAHVEFGTSDTDSEIATKLIDAIEAIRVAGGVQTTAADLTALRAALNAAL